jgi:hypothetical protein
MKRYPKRTEPEHPATIEAWADVAMSYCASCGFPPGRYPEMRRRYAGTDELWKELLTLEIRSTPLCRLKKAGLEQWSVEAGVLRFAEYFTAEELQNARWRLAHACDPRLR